MPPGPHFFDPMIFGTELVFTIIAFIFCFAIYYKTRESYELTKHPGIRYFRDAFLFFGLSYVMRFLFSLVLFSGMAFDFFIPREMFAPLFILPLGYLSTIAIFYLIFSLVWKRVNNTKILVLGHLIAILVPLLAFLTRSHMLLLYMQTVLLIIAVLLLLFIRKEKAGLSKTKILYLLVFGLWLINLFVIDSRRPFPPEIEILFRAVSLIVFILIYYKVYKWAR